MFEQEKRYNTGLGLILAIVFALGGTLITALLGWLLEWQTMYWVGGGIIGAAASLGFHLGNGKPGPARFAVIIVMSVIGSFLAVWFGYALFFNSLIGFNDLGLSLEITLEMMFEGFGGNFFAYEGELTRNFLAGAVIGVISGWKNALDKNGESLEELEQIEDKAIDLDEL